MDEKIRCPYCGRENVVRRGFRKLKKRKKRVYFCKDCFHRFSLGLERKRFDARMILNAVCTYNQGYNYEETRDILSRKHRVSTGVSSIFRWVKEYDLGYSDIRSRIVRKHKFPLVIGRVFKHSDLIYNFKCHKGKLKEFGKFSGLKDFIFGLNSGVEVATSFTKTLTLPEDVATGNHTYFVNITYKDASTTGEDYFMVKSKVTKAAKYWKEIIIVLAIIVVLVLVFFLFKEKLFEKKILAKEERLEKKQRKEEAILKKVLKQLKKKKK